MTKINEDIAYEIYAFSCMLSDNMQNIFNAHNKSD